MKRYKFYPLLLMASAFLSSCKKNEDLPPSPIDSNGCEINFLKGDVGFETKIITLAEDAGKLNYETGYLLYHSKSTGFRYEKITGNPEEASIVFAPKGQFDGMMHSHYGDLYPNFSSSDIRAIYEAYYYEKMNDYQKFISVVVSGSDTSYLLKISDLSMFLRFSSQNLVSRDNFLAFETRYHKIQKEGQWIHGINRSFENAMLEMLATSGLTLYRSAHPFQVWIKIERNQKGTQSFSCW